MKRILKKYEGGRRILVRLTDQYGGNPMDTMFIWIPEVGRFCSREGYRMSPEQMEVNPSATPVAHMLVETLRQMAKS